MTPAAHTETLPECRMRATRGRTLTPLGNFVPVYCANCGRPMGLVDETVTYSFALCDSQYDREGHETREGCADRYGEIAYTMKLPDAKLHENAMEAQMELFGRPATPLEVAEGLEDPSHVFARLKAEFDKKLRRRMI